MTGTGLVRDIEEDGFVVLPNVVPQAVADATVDAIDRRRQLLERLNPALLLQALRRGMFPMWNAEEQWVVRGLPSVRDPFVALHRSEHLWSSMDRCGFRPRGLVSPMGLDPHWDDDHDRWDFAAFQGVAALIPSTLGAGEFICWPSAYRAYRDGGRSAAERESSSRTSMRVHVELPLGALLIFDYRLLHATGPHEGTQSRAVQYVSHSPVSGAAERRRRIDCWQRGLWRGDTKDALYELPDQAQPSLSPDGFRALMGDDQEFFSL
jgi:hypothetical protein